MQQTIEYNVYVPQIGETLLIGGISFTVREYEAKDRIIIEDINTKQLTRIVIVNGNWQPDPGFVKIIFPSLPSTSPLLTQTLLNMPNVTKPASPNISQPISLNIPMPN